MTDRRAGRPVPATRFLLALAVLASPASAAGPVRGELAVMLKVCTPCHGPTGLTKSGGMRSLAGRSRSDLTAAMEGVRAGTLPHPETTVPVGDWSDSAILALARYYSRIR